MGKSKRSSCGECGTPLEPRDRIEERLEYRRVSDQARIRTTKLREVCRSCVEVLTGNRDPHQGSLI